MDKYLVHEQPGDGPGTHALVFGVGKYPHLIGGENPCHNPDGMRQLTSPPISARQVAEWLIKSFNDPNKPLRTVALLLSEENSQPFPNRVTGEVHRVEVANVDNAEEAIKEWKNRGDSDPGDRLVFYFCGHGTAQGNDVALLMSDFCASDVTPLEGAIDFGALYRALRTAQASEQLFFIDACRANSDSLIESSGYVGKEPLAGGRRPPGLPDRLAPAYYATLKGDKAYALANDVSLFTKSLLRSFNGAGSEEIEADDWRVNTTSLKRAIDHFMRELVDSGKHRIAQVPPTNELITFDLHYLLGPPMIPVYVGCQPEEDSARAELFCTRGGNEIGRRGIGDVDPEHPTEPWEVDLPYGEYHFEASFPAGDPPRRQDRTVFPPVKQVTLKEQV